MLDALIPTYDTVTYFFVFLSVLFATISVLFATISVASAGLAVYVAFAPVNPEPRGILKLVDRLYEWLIFRI